MTPRRATLADAATLARLNTHVQSWHAAHYPEAFFPHPDPAALTDYFTDRLSDPACTAFLTGEPATGYALCQLQTRDTSIFSPGYRRLMIDHIAVAPEARRQGQGRADGLILDQVQQRILVRDIGVIEVQKIEHAGSLSGRRGRVRA